MAVLGEPGYTDYFEKVFGGDKQALIEPTILGDDELRAVACPVTILHGRNDLAFPIEEMAYPLAEILNQVDVHALAKRSHGLALRAQRDVLEYRLRLFRVNDPPDL